MGQTTGDSIISNYRNQLDSLIAKKQQTVPTANTARPMSPFLYRLMVPGTLYTQPIRDAMGVQWVAMSSNQNRMSLLMPQLLQDRTLMETRLADEWLARVYPMYPGSYDRTQGEMMAEGSILSDVEKPIEQQARLSEKAETVEISEEDVEPLSFVTRRPNFWKISGSASLNFTQSYFSDNWYKGGEKNYSGLALLTLSADYDNKQKLKWENKLELQLGFQTARSDTCHTFRATSNLFRLTSKLGYQAAKNWYYTGSVQAYTQLYPNYKSNSYMVTADFIAPLYLTLSIGMDYKFNKPKFSGSVNLSPLAYNMRYVHRPSLVTRYGIAGGHHSKHTFGPNIVVNYKWTIVKNIVWDARMYWFSNFDYTVIEWENTFTFTINKYLNAKLFIYPRFDDSSKAYKGEKNYFMMKEFLSLGLSYSW